MGDAHALAANGFGSDKVPLRVKRKNESAIRFGYSPYERQQMQSELSEPVQFVSTIKTPFLQKD